MAETMNSQDHDLLIKIDTKLERVISDVSDLKTNLSGDVEGLKTDHVGRQEFEALQNWRYYLAGAIVVLVAVFSMIILPEYKAMQGKSDDLSKRVQTVENNLQIKTK